MPIEVVPKQMLQTCFNVTIESTKNSETFIATCHSIKVSLNFYTVSKSFKHDSNNIVFIVSNKFVLKPNKNAF
jgi:hypothetical protein